MYKAVDSVNNFRKVVMEVRVAANHWLSEINRKKVRHESNRQTERVAI